MGDIIMNLALQYAKARGLNAITDKAIDYAYETLGIENEEEDYTGGGIYGMRNAFSPANLGRTALNSFAKNALTGGSSGITTALPVLAGLMYLGHKTNPLNKSSYNYNPYLRDELNYAGGAGYLTKSPTHGGSIYGQNSVLRGRNAVTGKGYRTNLENLRDQLQTFKNKGVNKYGIPFSKYLDNRLTNTNKEILGLDQDGVNKELAEETKTQNRKSYKSPHQDGSVHGGGYNSGDGGSYSGAGEDSNWGGGEKDGGFIDGTNRRYFKNGGIASLWQR
jgi:hypothetical protein